MHCRTRCCMLVLGVHCVCMGIRAAGFAGVEYSPGGWGGGSRVLVVIVQP